MAEPEVSKGGWWSRKKTWQKVLLIIGGVFIALIVLGAFLPEVEEVSDAAAGSTTTVAQVVTTTEGEIPGETTTTAPKTTTTAQETTTTQADLPGIGDPVRDGKFEFIVTGIEEPGKVYNPEDVLEDEAIGEWFIVFMTVENIGDQEQSFFADNQSITWDGKEFGAEGFTWNGTSIENLNPGIILEAIVMFDVPASFPEGGVGTVLELHDSALSGGVNVYL